MNPTAGMDAVIDKFGKDIWVTVPDEKTLKSISDIWTDQEAMERAINLWGKL